MRRFVYCLATVFAIAFAARPALLRAETSSPAPDYLTEIKPIFAKHCVACHGEKKQENGLRLDASPGILAGGDSGPVLIAGASEKSLLLHAVRGTSDTISQMPTEGDPLSETQIKLLATWIDAGAKLPDEKIARVAGADHWSFQPIQRPPLPAVRNSSWPQTPIDYFILARLEEQGIAPSSVADKTQLLRRVYLDLVGLPPTPAEIQSFLADESPDAYEKVVDRLLASPAYGERWGRHWLDLARYADSNGYTIDSARNIWKYREWVIGAINRGMPFDQFTIEQIAGDMLPAATLEQQVATGFHRNTLTNEEGGTDPEQFRVEAVADRVSTVGSVFLGLTLGCARCHTHKYDPITQAEFYQFFAMLNNCDEPAIEAPSMMEVMRGDLSRRDELNQQIAKLKKGLKENEEAICLAREAWEASLGDDRDKLPQAVRVALEQKPENRSPKMKQDIVSHFAKMKETREQFPLLDEIAKLEAQVPKIETTLVVKERPKPRETFVHKRGDFLDPGPQVTGKSPAVLPPLATTTGEGGRLDLAKWLVAADQPLTPRVVMSRDWQKFFGRGIVETEDDFGVQGTKPSHPALLEWLAAEFLEQKWNVKAMHRLMVTSAVYQQSSSVRSDLATIDPQNILLARQSRLRLDAEIVRDVALATSGLITNELGGPSVFPPQPDGVYAFTQNRKNWVVAKDDQRFRRGMYTFFWRSAPDPSLMVFDAPGANTSCTRRLRSNTPLQSLTLANDAAFFECAVAMADRVLAESTAADDATRAAYAFVLATSREPTSDEQAALLAVLHAEREAIAPKQQEPASKHLPATPLKLQDRTAGEFVPWVRLCRVLLNLDETITRE